MAQRRTQQDKDIDAVMAASRALVAIVAHSFADARSPVTLPQWRVLVVVGQHGPMSSGELAGWMEVNPSSTTRMCDTLVRAKLLDRREDPDDRRRTQVSLTRRGEKLVESLLEHRRRAIAAILAELPAARRRRVAEAMQDFADAAGDQPEHFVAGVTPQTNGRRGS